MWVDGVWVPDDGEAGTPSCWPASRTVLKRQGAREILNLWLIILFLKVTYL
jgi:hypothetical protein